MRIEIYGLRVAFGAAAPLGCAIGLAQQKSSFEVATIKPNLVQPRSETETRGGASGWPTPSCFRRFMFR